MKKQTPEQIAALIKKQKGSIAKKIRYIFNVFGLELILNDKSNHLDVLDKEIHLKGIKTKYDFCVAMHELAHFILGHTKNTVQNEAEANLFADAVSDVIHGDGGYLFGCNQEANLYYEGSLNIEALTEFCISLEIKRDLQEDLQEFKKFQEIFGA